MSFFYLKLVGSYIKGWLKTREKHLSKKFESNTKVSIIVTGRNEAENVEKCLESLQNQHYAREKYEIIFVNDFSEDETLERVKRFSNIQILDLKKLLAAEFANKANKKRGITIGVEKSKFDVVITCDADCFYGQHWLEAFVEEYNKSHYKLITAPVLFNKSDGLLSKFLELDLISLMGITCGSIKNQKPNMVNGANMLFEKKTFIEVNGYEGNENVASGDDTFLMQKINSTYERGIGFLKNIEAIALTDAPISLSEFVNQRIRWTSKSVSHADKNVFRDLSLNYLFYLVTFLNLFFLSFINIIFLKIGIVMLLLKTIQDAIFFKNLLQFFKRMDIFKYLIVIEIMHLVYISLLGLLSLYGKYSWKGRKI